MSKKIISHIVMAIGILIILITLLLGIIGIPKPGFGQAKIAFGILGVLILFTGGVLFFRRETKGSLLAILKPRSRPELIFLSIGLLAGILFSIFIPYGAGFDESAHVIRVFDIANLSLLPNRGNDRALGQFYLYSYQRQDFQTPAFDQFKKETFLAKPEWDTMSSGETLSTYTPVNYIFQSLVAGIGWQILNLPVIPVIILIRLVGFLFYLLACYLTLRMLPFGKWVFMVLALSPMALFQASTINIDGFTNAISFLFIGYVLKVYAERKTPIDSKRAWCLALLSILVGCVKPGTILLLLLLLILFKNKFRSKDLVWLIISGAVLSVTITVVWALISIVNLGIGGGRTLMTEIVLVFNNLPDFLGNFIRGSILSLKIYYKDWVGMYGYWVGQVPVLTYVLYPLALLFAFIAETKSRWISRGTRILIFVIGLVCLACIASYEFVFNYVPGVQGYGANGRYFLPFIPVVFLALAGSFSLSARVQKIARGVVLACILAAVSLYGFGLYRTYYTNCVYAVTPAHPCTLPIYKNLDVAHPYIAHVKANTTVSQSFTPLCSEIDSVQVRVQSIVADSQDKVLVTVSDEDQKALATKSFPLTSLKYGTMIKIPLQQKVLVGKEKLWISLSLPLDDSQGADLGILGRSGAAIYADGELFFNQYPQDGDLFFQYTCSVP